MDVAGQHEIGVDVVAELPDASADRHCAHDSASLVNAPGWVITPATAEAATVAGEAMKMRALGSPMRPLKLRVLAVMHVSPGPSTPIWPPPHAPQVALVTPAPASSSVAK